MSPFGLGWPNLISIFRILLVPVLIALIVQGSDAAAYAAAAVFVFGASTDRLDGYVARRFSSVTRTGQWLDPLSDKLFVAAPVVTLTALDRFPLWAAVVILAREAIVVILRAVLGTRGRAMPASPLAKLKTGAQLLAILLFLIPDVVEVLHPFPFLILIGAVALTVWSGVEYALAARRPQPVEG